jgi:hypothetical protein
MNSANSPSQILESRALQIEPKFSASGIDISDDDFQNQKEHDKNRNISP